MGCFLRDVLRSVRNKKSKSQRRSEEKPPVRAPERGAPVSEKRPVSDEPQAPPTANPPVPTIKLISSQLDATEHTVTDTAPYELPGSSPPTSSPKPVSQAIVAKDNNAEDETTGENTKEDKITKDKTTKDQVAETNTAEAVAAQAVAAEVNLPVHNNLEDKSSESITTENITTDSSAGDNTAKADTVDVNLTEDNTATYNTVEDQNTEDSTNGTFTAENVTIEGTGAEVNTPEVKEAGITDTEVDTAGFTAAEVDNAEDKTTEDSVVENTTPENATPENATTEDTTTENTPTENTTTENTTTENTTTENVTTENVTTENVTTENVTTENVTTENVTTENVTTENSSPGVNALELAEAGAIEAEAKNTEARDAVATDTEINTAEVVEDEAKDQATQDGEAKEIVKNDSADRNILHKDDEICDANDITETDVADSGPIDNDAVESGIAGNDIVDQSNETSDTIPDDSVHDDTLDNSVVDDGNVGNDMVDSSIIDSSILGSSIMDNSIVDSSVADSDIEDNSNEAGDFKSNAVAENAVSASDNVDKGVVDNSVTDNDVADTGVVENEIASNDAVESSEQEQQHGDLNDTRGGELLSLLAANYEEYKNFNPPKAEGTYGWFLEDKDFCSWRDRSESGLIWVSGGPGCGKSVLSRSLIDERQLTATPTTSTVCHFFFKDGDQRRVYSHDALSAILDQLLIQDVTGKFMETLDRHKNHGDALRGNSDELWNILLDCASMPDAGEIVCVLDALDECREDERNIIIKKIEEFFSPTATAARRTCRLKFFITCRPHYQIESSINRLSDVSFLTLDGDDHSLVVSADINSVVDARIPELLKTFPEKERDRVAARLKSMSNRTYLWLRLIFSVIETSYSSYSGPSDVDQLLDELPVGHAEAYEQMLKRMHDPRHTHNLLQIIIAAKRPLSLDEANHALALADTTGSVELWPRDSFEDILKNFSGLLVTTHASKVSFIHRTVKEFLTTFLTTTSEINGKKWEWRGRFKAPVYHRAMTRSCIRCLALPDQRSTIHGGTAAEGSDAFYEYAASSWTDHCRELDNKKLGSELLQKAIDLCHVTEESSHWLDHCPPWWTDRDMERRRLGLNELTPLAVAAYFGLLPVVRALLKRGDIDLNVELGDIGTVLHVASAGGYANVIKILLDHGANVHATNKSGETPFMLSSINGRRDALQLLVERGAN
ncbi:hypothetical protein G7054_g11943 [Neopestalotiopsis clavispora]|nr:hypothetical protein G7054_g11943 [Neopestalotiopsis clavispora]